MQKKQTVFVGLSGGVDSSVAALRLLRDGYDVVGVFIKTWQPDFIRCDWEKERLDAMRVAAKLDIPFLTCDAEDAYKHEVADYMIEEYRAGRTPNPDVMCNKHVKFGVFLDFAVANGGAYVATGHYAQREQRGNDFVLKRGADTNKDQSYFLWTLSADQLAHTLFPIGDSQKEAIRAEAKRAGLLTHKKSDSQGVCFLGEIDMKQFLAHYIQEEAGTVVDTNGQVVGEHDGVLFYTIGQRHGFQITETDFATRPHYVVTKDIEKNQLTVAPEMPVMRSDSTITLRNTNHIGATWSGRKLSAQSRYRQTPFTVVVEEDTDDCAILRVLEEIEKPSAGQSCVLYDGDTCLGGGIIQ